jgi:succinyl-diaminopimelate desuccinylase
MRPALDLSADLVTLTRALCDVPSVSGEEGPLADLVEEALRAVPHLSVLRDGNVVIARTDLGRAERVVVAGHLDTVPVAGNLPTRVVGEGPGAQIWGRGTVDMKGGVAVQLALAAALSAPTRDVTWVFYDLEEVEAERNGLGRIARTRPELLAGDAAVLCEPTSAGIEGGCNGTLRAEVVLHGVAAHSARSWRGVNAVHAAAPVLATLAAYRPRTADVDGLTYREGLNAVGIRGGVAGNVIPDECVVTVNYRFAPDRSPQEAEAHVREVFAGHDVRVVDVAGGARPGLDRPALASFVAAATTASGRPPAAKQGWTDVARFGELGIPAVNYGPGDPLLAHADDERCPVSDLTACFAGLRAWLTS